jgi:hypothetical protein
MGSAIGWKGIEVHPKARADFDWLTSQANSDKRRLKTILDHVVLANSNRRLVHWTLNDALYHDFVLLPQIEAGIPAVALDWRRPLWESL